MQKESSGVIGHSDAAPSASVLRGPVGHLRLAGTRRLLLIGVSRIHALTGLPPG